jgi:Arc/MetJ-type ribon-helix-helix transcriptional regulator
MSRQITVRIPEELADFVDALVAEGVVSSRAEAVTVALTRERRRRTALRDVAILRQDVAHGAIDVELDALAAHAADLPFGLDA